MATEPIPLPANVPQEYFPPRSLVIRGQGEEDPNIPTGFIKVNGQLQPSQAKPQPLPWWIQQADEEAEARRQRDEMQAQMAQQQNISAEAAKGIAQAKRYEGMLGFDADRKRGVPIHEAMRKWGHLMYSSNPATMTALARQSATAAEPPEKMVGPTRLVRLGPDRYGFAPQQAAAPGTPIQASNIVDDKGNVIGQGVRSGGSVVKPLREKVDANRVSPGNKLAGYRMRLNALEKDIEAAAGDESALAPLRETREQLLDAIAGIAPIEKKSSPVAKSATPDKSLAREEAKATIKARPRIAEDVRKLFKQTYGEDL